MGSAWLCNPRILLTLKKKYIRKSHFFDDSNEYKFILVPTLIPSENILLLRNARFFIFSLNRHVSSASLTPLQFVMCLCGLGSFLLQDMVLNLPTFAVEGQSKKFTVNMLLTVFFIVTPGPVVWSELFASTVCWFLSRISYSSSYVVFFGDAVA